MRTRIISILVSVMLVLSLVSTALAANGSSIFKANTTAVVNNPIADDRLNLRTKPSEDAPTLGKYYNGTFLDVLSDEKDGWVKVRIFTLEGYMMAKFLVAPDQIPIGAATIPAVIIKNTGGTGLNLRKSQSIDSSSLGLYKNGQTVRVFGLSETWCHVQTNDGKVGFMLRERLSPVLEYQKDSTAIAVGKTAKVNNPNPNERLNLRTAPRADAPTLGKYYNGTYVEVLETAKNGWMKVRFGNLTGYMLAVYLADESVFVNTVLPSYTINNTSGTGLNLRESQSTKSKSLGFYSNGDTGWVYGVGETWCHVQAPDGKVGFMLRESLSPVPEFNKGSSNSSDGTPPFYDEDYDGPREGDTNYDENGVPIAGNG